jgi:hypothetical protein
VKSLKEGSMEDRGDAAVAIFSAEPRKGTAKFLHLRAPLEVWLYQMIEDVEVLLLSPTASSGVVGIGVVVWWPAARVSTRTTERRRKGLQGFVRVFIRPLRSSMLVEVKNDGRDVALVVAVASSRASRTKTKARTSPRSYLGRNGIGLVWAKVWGWTMGCSWAATARYGPGEFFSPFYFLFLIFCFYIFYLNSYLNSILFAGICNYTNSFKI